MRVTSPAAGAAFDQPPSPRVVVSATERGKDLVHDGRSSLETARWLAGEPGRR
jgi:hypothetical protein